MSKSILVIDDDDFFALHLERIFGETFFVSHEWNGLTGLEKASSSRPDVILLDVEMPEIDGYAVCRDLKENPLTKDIPVIFISAHADMEDRLQGYEAGGDDFMSKPPVPDELKRKIALVLRNRQHNSELAERAATASREAMAAITSAGDAGKIMDFMREISAFTGFVEVAESTLKILKAHGLDASIQLRAKHGVISRNHNGFCSPLEESVLQTMSSCGGIVELKSRSAFNNERVSIIINNMPSDNPEMRRRLKDIVATISEAVDIHMASLELTFAAIDRGDTLLNLLHRNASTLREIERRYQYQRSSNSAILDQLVADIENSFIFLGLTDNQEKYLQDLARDAVDRAQALYNDSIETDAIMKSLGDGLDATLQQELQGASDASAEVENRIELF